MVDMIRTSYGTFLNRRMDAMLARIEKKVALFTKIPEENMEDMQVLKYENGQKYGDHWDVFDERTLNEKDGYQRIATVLMYLSDVELGGETAFPSSTAWVNPAQAWADPPYTKCADKVVSVRPHKGDALLFFSLDPEDKLDTKSLHAGCPVLRGTKWSATKWIHVKVSASAVLSAPRCGPQLAARPPLPPSLRGASCAAGRGRLTRTHREALPQEPAPGRGGRGRLHGRPRELRQLGGARRVQEQPGLHGGVRRLVPAQLRGLHAREDKGRRREQAPRRPVPAGGRAVPAAAGNPPVTTR